MSDFCLKLNRSPKQVHQVTSTSFTGRPVTIRGRRNGAPGPEAFKALEQEYQERTEAAYQFGFEDGRKLGAQEGRKAVEQSLAMMQSAMRRLQEQHSGLMKEVDETVVRLAVMLAEKIIRRETRADREIVRNMVRESIRLVEDRRRIIIRVNPGDWQVVKDDEAGIKALAHGMGELEIKEDPGIQPGGCILESDSGILDARWDVQLKELETELLETE